MSREGNLLNALKCQKTIMSKLTKPLCSMYSGYRFNTFIQDNWRTSCTNSDCRKTCISYNWALVPLEKKPKHLMLIHLINKASLLQPFKINHFMRTGSKYLLQNAVLPDLILQAFHKQLKCSKRIIFRFSLQLLPQKKLAVNTEVVQIHRYYVLLTVFKGA